MKSMFPSLYRRSKMATMSTSKAAEELRPLPDTTVEVMVASKPPIRWPISFILAATPRIRPVVVPSSFFTLSSSFRSSVRGG